MSSINIYQDPPISLTLGFKSPDLTTLNILQSGSAALLRPLGFSVTGWLPDNAYNIIIPVSNESDEFSEVVTSESAMNALEVNVSLTVTPTLLTAWTDAGSPNPISDSQTDVTAESDAA